MEPSPKKCTVAELKTVLQHPEECQIVDVREPFEIEAEKIAGCLQLPLSSLDQHRAEILDPKKPVYLICKSGSRAGRAAEKLKGYGFKQLHVMDGGLDAWLQAGEPVIRSSRVVWSLERQVRGAAGSLVLLGILLSFFVHRYFIALSLFVGMGLVFSAITNTCGMGLLLAKMPWNKTSQVKPAVCCGAKENE